MNSHFRSHFHSYFANPEQMQNKRSASSMILNIILFLECAAVGIVCVTHFGSYPTISNDLMVYFYAPFFVLSGYNIIAFLCQVFKLPLANFNYFFIYLNDVVIAGVVVVCVVNYFYFPENTDIPKFIDDVFCVNAFNMCRPEWIYLVICLQIKVVFHIQRLIFYKFRVGFVLYKMIVYFFFSTFGVFTIGSILPVIYGPSNYWFPTETTGTFYIIALVSRGVGGILILMSLVNDSYALTKWVNFFLGLTLVGNLTLSIIYILDNYSLNIPIILIDHMVNPKDAIPICYMTVLVTCFNLLTFIASVIGFPQPPRPKHVVQVNQNPTLYSTAV